MCEVRRVFHNVNSDTNITSLSSKNKSTTLFVKGNETSRIPKENENSNAIENHAGKNISKTGKSEFSEPKLLTSLKIIESLQNIDNDKKLKKPPKNNIQLGNNAIKQKASRRVNIPFEEKVYKGLIELQVTNEDLGLHTNFPLKPKEFIKIKEPEPALSDYFKPKFDKEYIVKPNIPKFEINPVFVIEIPSVLAATKNWEPGES